LLVYPAVAPVGAQKKRPERKALQHFKEDCRNAIVIFVLPCLASAYLSARSPLLAQPVLLLH
ncbi:MAG: hypothetical protein JSU96_19285, partial [Acidobacteriota bacterium]